MKKGLGCLAAVVVVVVILAVMAGGSYNRLVSLSQAVDAQWAQVESVYQRRADLIPNLVASVQGAASFEKSTLESITQARASVGQIQGPSAQNLPNDPAAFARWQAAQDQLSGALSRLLVVVERYPDLKATQNFRDLQAQLEGTENRIAVARNRYIQDVQGYNVLVRKFPTNLTAKMFGYAPKPNFTVENESAISKPPSVDFTPPAPPKAPKAPTPPEKKPDAG